MMWRPVAVSFLVVVLAAPTTIASPRVSLAAEGGYGWSSGGWIPTLRGPVVQASLTVAWSRPGRKLFLGWRLDGFVSPHATGTTTHDHVTDKSEGLLWGGHGGLYLEYQGLWLSPGLGFHHSTVTYIDPVDGGYGGSATRPEVSVAGGLVLPLTSRFCLRLGGEVASLLFFVRATVSAGVQVSF